PRGATAALAEAFARALAERLGCDPARVFPAFEDAWYYLWRERRLPVNVDPFDSRLDDPLERARLARVFGQGLGESVGAVLPLAHDGHAFVAGRWFLRDEPCRLLPGDSPMGLRLPLDSLPWVAAGDIPASVPADPFAPRTALARHHAVPRLQGPFDHPPTAAEEAPAPFESRAGLLRTALCVEPRGGTLHVFMPPLTEVAAYLELVARVEDTAQALGCAVVIEGYEPPRDPRLVHLRVTPDPGVLEVNVNPVADWPALVEQTETVYDTARATRLTTEKFMLDGRHTGTGGGNHFVLGGASPADSPFLRRPDLLASMVAYWHNHPALSYLFSGLFIGPTSQAPRVDEARHEAVYELETAFRELARQQRDAGDVAPWLVDRLFRHLLVDVTGNTHRAEFCIDKLYAPEGVAGRLGLLELRAFEMPPHARMSLAQQLLMRGLVARFWQQPYRPHRLQRWGTALQDRFMLPHFVWDDFTDVIAELREFGLPFDAAWFAPHVEFRFPRLGDCVARGVEIELRSALEPWHVLGEENAGGGTARYVDSSVERLQVKVRGLVDGRHVVTCNGRSLPLHPTGTVGEAVAGVRYRAWQPPSCLHPTIGVHSPLTFDLVDTWSGRALGGCEYHVMHPGGRNYATFPVNANEAEARRLARFFRFGHTPGSMRVEAPEVNAEYPLTLDLRRTDR
ncbi:MAG: transglutaminase family protein, partial [Gammaproteobacteria bacterium]